MKSVFMVAEKPSLAASLATILSNGAQKARKGKYAAINMRPAFLNFYFLFFPGSNRSCSVHEWTGNFKGESALFKMTSVCGHVMSLDFVGIKQFLMIPFSSYLLS